MATKSGCDRQLDRIATGIFERLVKSQRKEQLQLARRTALLPLRMELAGLEEKLKASLLSLSEPDEVDEWSKR